VRYKDHQILDRAGDGMTTKADGTRVTDDPILTFKNLALSLRIASFSSTVRAKP
jgi:hypothetical protein